MSSEGASVEETDAEDEITDDAASTEDASAEETGAGGEVMHMEGTRFGHWVVTFDLPPEDAPAEETDADDEVTDDAISEDASAEKTDAKRMRSST